MAGKFQSGATVEDSAESALFDETQDWVDAMGDVDKSDGEIAVAPLSGKLQQGFKSYVRDLPQLLREKREGYMVAYYGDERLGIAASDAKLHQILAKRPQFDDTKEDTFVTRVTEMDASEFGVQL